MPENEKSIIIGCDHAAFPLKESIKGFLENQGLNVKDVGAHGPDSVDYPKIGITVASSISKGEFPRGILLCGTGIGMSLAANRFKRARATLCQDIFAAKMSRLHNDSNILVVGGRVIGEALALEIVRTWLETPFEGDRHQRRLDMFDNLGADGS